MEMMITVVIAAILVTAAVPGFRGFITDNRLATQVNAFVTALHVARAEAIKRNLTVTVCKSEDGKSCGNNSKGFEQGWIIFTDQQNPGKVDNNETIINVNQGMPQGMSLIDINLNNNGGPISYRADGTSVWNNTTLRLCQKGSNNGRRLIINSVGRIRVENIDDCPTA